MRPNLGIVASLDSEGDLIRSGYGAVTGQSAVGSPLNITQPLSRPQIAAPRARTRGKLGGEHALCRHTGCVRSHLHASRHGRPDAAVAGTHGWYGPMTEITI
jgi:hypothetical protein